MSLAQHSFNSCRSILNRFRGRTWRLVIVNASELVLFTLAAILAFLLRFDFVFPHAQLPKLFVAAAIWLPTKSIAFHLSRIDRSTWRFVSASDFWKLLYVTFAACCTSALFIVLITPWHFPRSLYAIDFMLSVLLIGGFRLCIRSLYELPSRARPRGQKAFVYGAGAAGSMLIREIRQNSALKYRICGFIDDDRNKRGLTIQGVRVLGAGRDLPHFSVRYGVELILIATPSAGGPELTKILNYCACAKLPFRMMPSLSEIVNGVGRSVLREVAVEDLLGRKPVRIDQELVGVKLKDQTVLVTGAAGSIGSELCRQIASFRPKLLVGLDAAETPLFQVEQELKRSFHDLVFQPLIGSVQDSERLAEVFGVYQPSMVFHAAAYKHVPMMEAHVFQAIENNILGTYSVAKAASQTPGCDFVMISSDKAVRPTSIMGLTKRVAELVVSSIPHGSAKFVSVRFGNVLGSNGSVVPIFRQQIAAGRAITVTHPEMRRYFMTIPEAVQLVLQASFMGNRSEIFVLDMGEQVKIVDLARNLILLSGLRPDDDIKIEFTGIRPGEKLYEELNYLNEETCSTYHEKIRIFAGNGNIEHLDDWMAEMRQMCTARDPRIIARLKELVPEYSPSTSVLHLLPAKPLGAPTSTLEFAEPAKGFHTVGASA